MAKRMNVEESWIPVSDLMDLIEDQVESVLAEEIDILSIELFPKLGGYKFSYVERFNEEKTRKTGFASLTVNLNSRGMKMTANYELKVSLDDGSGKVYNFIG